MSETLTMDQKPVSAAAPEWLKKFFYSDAYLAIIGILIIVAWYTKIPIIAFLPASILVMTALIVLDDFSPMLPIILYAPCIFQTKDPAPYWWQLVGAIPLVIGLVFHFVYYRPKRAKLRMVIPQLLIAAAMLLGGLGSISKEHYLGTLTYNVMLGFLPLIFYVVMAIYSKPNKYNDFAKYFAKVSVWYGILLGAEVIAMYIMKSPDLNKLGAGFAIDLGWGIDNNVATILMIASPMAFYLATTDKHKVFYTVLGILNFAFTMITFSRGGILYGAVGAVLSGLIALKINSGKARLKIFIPMLITVVGLLTVYLIFMDPINTHLLKLINVDDHGISGRDDLYREAVEVFKANPIFGAGLGFDGEYYAQPEGMYFYWFHSTFFQILGCTGAVGLAAYAIYYVVRYAIVFRHFERNTFAQFAFIGLLCFEAYSMMDTGTFIPYPIMVYVMLLTLCIEQTNDNIFLPEGKLKGRF